MAFTFLRSRPDAGHSEVGPEGLRGREDDGAAPLEQPGEVPPEDREAERVRLTFLRMSGPAFPGPFPARVSC